MSAPDFRRIARGLNGRPPLAASWILFAVLTLCGAFALWAATTEIDEVIRAQARIVTSQELQVVQAAETGQITEILVRDGQRVRAGDVLVRLEPRELLTQYNQALEKAGMLEVRIARLQSELDGTPLAFPPDLAETFPRVVGSERALHEGRKVQIASERAQIAARSMTLEREGARARAEEDRARTALALVEEEIALVAPLVERGIEPETSLIRLRREAAERESQIALARADGARIAAQIAEQDEKLRLLEAGARAEVLEQMSQAISELGVLEQSLPALELRAARSEIRAPVDGIVNRLLVTTLGGVVGQGASVAEIVPLGETTRLEAYVLPADIAFVRPDQTARVRLTAYDSSRYGALEGQVTRISADAVLAPDGQTSVFVVDIVYSDQLTDVDGQVLDVIPGMIAEVDFLAGRKTVMAYLTRPVVRVKERAFRD
jgi:adhesin transport system membrane fusion protein